MLFKKQIQTGRQGQVSYANGSIQFQAVHLNVYSYVIDGIAIDAGSQSLSKQFKSFLNDHTFEALYCTHLHEDHTGCAAWLQQERSIPIFLSPLSIEEAEENGHYPLYRQLFWGKRKAFQALPIPETFQSNKYEWKSIFSPGHSSDHTTFLNLSTGQLFSGDLFVQVRTKVIMDTESIPQIIDSIQQVLSFDFKEMFCNHAGYVKDGKQKLKEKLEYLQQISYEVTKFHQEGLNIKEIQQQLFPKKYPITTFSRGQWDSKHIITSILQPELVQ